MIELRCKGCSAPLSLAQNCEYCGTPSRTMMSPDEVAMCLGIGRNSVYQAIHTGQIPSIRIGKLLLIPRTAIEKMLA